MNLGEIWFESRPEHRLSLLKISRFASVTTVKLRYRTDWQTGPKGYLPSRCHSNSIQSFDAALFNYGLIIDSLNNTLYSSCEC